MRILITGSREWTDHDTIQRALVHAGQTAEKHPQQVTIVHGDARGADTIAKELGEHFGCTVEAHEVTREDWQRYGRSAGHRRNAEMVALGADICLAFPIGASPGTRGCIKLCEKAGIPVIVHEGQMP